MRRIAITATILGLAILLLPAVPALAHPMDGYGTNPTDDWGSDEHLLCRPADCTGEISSGNVVGVWQVILWSENYLAACGSAGVDGLFGTTTRNASQSLQSYWGITADGMIGDQSWGKADNNLVYVDIPGGKELVYDADRSTREVDFYKPYAAYQIYWQTSAYWHNTDHYNRTIDQC